MIIAKKTDVLHRQISFNDRAKELTKGDEKQEQERFSPFKRWTQFNLEQTPKIMWLTLHHPKASAILQFLVDQMDNYNAVMCSYECLCELLEIGRTTASTAIRVLKKNGFIEVLKSGTSNIYAINDSVYWKSWGKNLRFSKFPANIVLSLSEQEAEYRKKISFDKVKEVKLKKRELPDGNSLLTADSSEKTEKTPSLTAGDDNSDEKIMKGCGSRKRSRKKAPTAPVETTPTI